MAGTRMRALTALVLLVAAGCARDDAPGAGPPADPASAATSPAVTTEPGPILTVLPPPNAADEPQPGPFEIVTADGLVLEAERFGVGEDFVVLSHMRPADMSSWFSFAGFLGGEGFTAITFNFRGYGNSEGAGFAVEVDVAAAVDAARTLGADRVFLIGASMGGTGAIAAAGASNVDGVITLSAPDRFEGVDAAAAAADVSVPMLLIAAEDDEPYASDAEVIASQAGGPARVMILPGRKHGTDLFVDHSELLTGTILEFLAGDG